ncbi:MAG: hypothetical protein ACLGGX_07200 [Bdellovibrionia bacterium]
MKYILSIAITLVSFSSFAGGGGGGGVMAKVMAVKANIDDTVLMPSGLNMKTPEIIFNMGQKDGLVKFAYGQLVDKKWQVQKIEMPEADLMVDASVMKALQDSKDLKSWAEIK